MSQVSVADRYTEVLASDRATIIRKANDVFRDTWGMLGGKIMLTPTVAADPNLNAIRRAVIEFNSFSHDNDPHGEHDFGRVEVDKTSYIWKIDYYDRNFEYGSDDPTDRFQTRRVLTIMQADEY